MVTTPNCSQVKTLVRATSTQKLFFCCLGGWSLTIPSRWNTDNFSKMTAYGKEINIQLSGNISGGHSCSQHANWMRQKLATSVALCGETQLHILEWPFIVPGTRCTCVMITLFNQLLDMPHLSREWMILGKGEMLTNRDGNKLVRIVFSCVRNISGIFYFNLWNMWPTHFACSFLFLFSVNCGCDCHTKLTPLLPHPRT